MTKQELAAKIWATANELRKNIKASEYKDYILGFMFYKYLSDKEIDYLYEKGGESVEDLIDLDKETIDMFKDHIGYFIEYQDLFCVWQEKGLALGAKDVSEAIDRFYSNLNSQYIKLFDKVFSVLSSGLTKLGENAGSRDSAVRSIVDLIWQIPPKSKDYDVLGYIYEYLIQKFSSEAKKDGAFYTPHGLTSLMAKIVADRLKDKQEVNVYDPTIGTAGLLLNIGKEVGKFIDTDKITYYGQELITETCNLAKMNLFMQDIPIQNIRVRNGDTLKEDWPYFDEDTAYEALPVDAVVSNPPYSQGWDPDTYKHDERFRKYGLAPQKKADFAFLLHCLYHVKDKEGIMAIVLPHGVLFRGGSEYTIRKNLVDNHNIETIIGFPSNMFFATGIPVIVMILSKGRKESDILFVDASASYGKEATQNILRDMDIQRIFDTVTSRREIENFSRVVKIEEIIENDYNLNIPRYVSVTAQKDPVDPFSVMTGKISNKMLSRYNDYWTKFPELKTKVFSAENDYNIFIAPSIKEAVFSDNDVKKYISDVSEVSSEFKTYLVSALLGETVAEDVHDRVVDELFSLYGSIELLDKYSVFQAFCDKWSIIDEDLIRIKNEGKQICKETEPNMVLVKDTATKKYVEIQKGIKGKIIPILMIQETYFAKELAHLSDLSNKASSLESEIEELWNELEDEVKTALSKDDDDDNTKMDNKKIADEVKNILSGFTTPEIAVLTGYLEIKKKDDKLAFISAHPEISWAEMKQNKDYTYGAAAVKAYIEFLKLKHDFETDTDEGRIVNIKKKTEEKSAVNKESKALASVLESQAVEQMSALSDEEINDLLIRKWIDPVMQNIDNDVEQVIMKLVNALQSLKEQYDNPMPEIDSQITDLESSLNVMLGELCGNETNMLAVELFRKGLF